MNKVKFRKRPQEASAGSSDPGEALALEPQAQAMLEMMEAVVTATVLRPA
jgi:hypothetical protein